MLTIIAHIVEQLNRTRMKLKIKLYFSFILLDSLYKYKVYIMHWDHVFVKNALGPHYNAYGEI